ncbi:hypothetical protein, partial [Escherichia coli]
MPILSWATDDVVNEALARLADEGRLPGAPTGSAPEPVTLLDEPIPARPESLADAPFDFQPTQPPTLEDDGFPEHDTVLDLEALPPLEVPAPERDLPTLDRLALDLDTLDVHMPTGPAGEVTATEPDVTLDLQEPSDFGDLSAAPTHPGALADG